MQEIINKLKKDTNNLDNYIYRKKRIFHKEIHIIYIDALISSDKVSDFVMRSLNKIHIPTYKNIINKISNFKYKELKTYDEIIY